MSFANFPAVVAVSALVGWSGVAAAADITGAGATFPYPVYAKWAGAYEKATGIGLRYQSIGSGGGVKQVTTRAVDFGASDMPMQPEELRRNGLIQFPAILGGVVPVYRLEGVKPGELRMTGPLLADIYLGKVRKWNDPAIVKLNPGAKLPADDIAVVHRSDGSGTTFLWTNYLSKVSPEFRSTVGEGIAVKWPTGVGGKGSEGVADYVRRTNGAIGYVEYAYARQNNLSHGQVRNKAGKFVQPYGATFKAAALGADWTSVPGMGVVLTDQPGDASWPIAGASFILLHVRQERPESGRQVIGFFDWSFRNGATMADELDYVPMPDAVVSEIRAAWKAVVDAAGKPIYGAAR